ncbi:benzoate 4-monooxygenase cytochrome P450 [Lineolata rhizophorae]|uniref:Benzoate 4-monooxygenase cytochrome P450 n=1 Tax=Lineolata rhizophorae TaxID=578093 RepID=A0A6A6PAH5_9PEZI|nr:benzoate 4-monooxygenase cytochrome P450 [Lineolata rhizophorae]
MSSTSIFICLCISALLAGIHWLVLEPLVWSHTSQIPGPKLFAITKWRLAYEDWKGSRTRTINALHEKYGPVVRIGPNEVSFNSLTALRTIYGTGSGFERTSFYRMFDVYGKQNLFTFGTAKEHSERKKMIAHAYSKSVMIKGPAADLVRRKVAAFLEFLENDKERANEIFSSLHYFALDSISEFVYGDMGRTDALGKSEADRTLIRDILDPARRRLSWFSVHFPGSTKWLYTRTKFMERLVTPFLPMQKPTYSGIRDFALKVWQTFLSAPESDKVRPSMQNSVMGTLWKHHSSQKAGGLQDLDIASECADHLLAGIDTTSDTLMFLIWALSRPENSCFQKKLADEVSTIPMCSVDDRGVPSVDVCERLVYLHAVIKETLRLYAPLPASEPRSSPRDTVIDAFKIPARTVVSMSPYSLHRNAEIFENALRFDPERWLGESAKVPEMKKWWWAFSSGGRMCIGMHLAMAEMTTLVATVYRNYVTSIRQGFEGITPGITSRFEVFYDASVPEMKEHTCLISFSRR